MGFMESLLHHTVDRSLRTCEKIEDGQAKACPTNAGKRLAVVAHALACAPADFLTAPDGSRVCNSPQVRDTRNRAATVRERFARLAVERPEAVKYPDQSRHRTEFAPLRPRFR